jgi:sugar phosphate isomerase/epimerase
MYYFSIEIKTDIMNKKELHHQLAYEFIGLATDLNNQIASLNRKKNTLTDNKYQADFRMRGCVEAAKELGLEIVNMVGGLILRRFTMVLISPEKNWKKNISEQNVKDALEKYVRDAKITVEYFNRTFRIYLSYEK